eukprot:scaffold10018_cov72-Phaeocystis_antarctica.AAC.3
MVLQSHRVDSTDRIMKKPELKLPLSAKQALALPRVQARHFGLRWPTVGRRRPLLSRLGRLGRSKSMVSAMSARSTPSDRNEGRGSPNSVTSPSMNHSSADGSSETSCAWMHADLACTILV